MEISTFVLIIVVIVMIAYIIRFVNKKHCEGYTYLSNDIALGRVNGRLNIQPNRLINRAYY